MTDTFLSLEKSYNEIKENEELHVLVLRLQGKNEKLRERAAVRIVTASPYGKPV